MSKARLVFCLFLTFGLCACAESVLESTTRIAEQGVAEAQFKLGVMYHNGNTEELSAHPRKQLTPFSTVFLSIVCSDCRSSEFSVHPREERRGFYLADGTCAVYSYCLGAELTAHPIEQVAYTLLLRHLYCVFRLPRR